MEKKIMILLVFLVCISFGKVESQKKEINGNLEAIIYGFKLGKKEIPSQAKIYIQRELLKNKKPSNYVVFVRGFTDENLWKGKRKKQSEKRDTLLANNRRKQVMKFLQEKGWKTKKDSLPIRNWVKGIDSLGYRGVQLRFIQKKGLEVIIKDRKDSVLKKKKIERDFLEKYWQQRKTPKRVINLTLKKKNCNFLNWKLKVGNLFWKSIQSKKLDLAVPYLGLSFFKKKWSFEIGGGYTFWSREDPIAERRDFLTSIKLSLFRRNFVTPVFGILKGWEYFSPSDQWSMKMNGLFLGVSLEIDLFRIFSLEFSPHYSLSRVELLDSKSWERGLSVATTINLK